MDKFGIYFIEVKSVLPVFTESFSTRLGARLDGYSSKDNGSIFSALCKRKILTFFYALTVIFRIFSIIKSKTLLEKKGYPFTGDLEKINQSGTCRTANNF